AEAESIGAEEVSKNILELIVVAVPFTDRDAMADNFGIKKGDLKPDTMVVGKGKNYGAHFYARGNHVYFGNNDRAVASIAKGKRVGPSLTAVQRRTFGEADLLLHLGTKGWGSEWKSVLKEVEAGLTQQDPSVDKDTVSQFVAALETAR